MFEDGRSSYGGHSGTLWLSPNGNGWGTVCDDLFTNREANAFCVSAGYRSGSVKPSQTRWGNIWMDDVQCPNVTSASVPASGAQCTFAGWDVHDCDHSEDVAISCRAYPVRLTGGQTEQSGRLEILYNGVWGTVC
ncbi:hypothetical protein GPECTOR_8g366 [Gonium pectorale]|uniref:SRCR domain-containing protein n=1 Tax=Gonium pectorale TaxID=33097 RepID=A0A150GT20_GONPE|nr:hypothetical protein GPECTOR_8g366 [Gonium pectorale]|eukprot:KXZ52996.1 hypothetical protein GPECTOR_8g366 [Gonium pectorale]